MPALFSRLQLCLDHLPCVLPSCLRHRRKHPPRALRWQSPGCTRLTHIVPDDMVFVFDRAGGGMRGCVTAGMISAIEHLEMRDCFDVVYGSSAGSLIGELASLSNGQKS